MPEEVRLKLIGRRMCRRGLFIKRYIKPALSQELKKGQNRMSDMPDIVQRVHHGVFWQEAH